MPGSSDTADVPVTHKRALTVEPALITPSAAPEPPVTVPPVIVERVPAAELLVAGPGL